MAKSQNSVREFATIGFLLLAVLFGMQIMVFVFGGMTAIDTFDDVSKNVINATGGYLNNTVYSIPEKTNANFSSWSVTEVWNSSGIGDQILLNSSEYIVNVLGTIRNGTNTVYPIINLTYSVLEKTDAEVTADAITTDSLNAIGNYSTQAGTQFTTLGIAITLILLVAVFLFFWVAFMGKSKGGDSAPGGFS